MTLGDRVVVMKEGRIEQQGSPMAIYLNPVNLFVATFIGAPAMNILDARLYPGYVDIEGQKIAVNNRMDKISIPESGRKIKLGIRPDFFIDEMNVAPGSSFSKIKNVIVDIVEPLGFEREIDATIGRQSIKAKLDLRTIAGEGDTINLCFDMDRAHFFDPETGRNLLYHTEAV